MADAIHEMSRKMMGITAVVTGGSLLGVISDGDLRRLIEHDPASSSHRLRLLHANPRTIAAEAFASGAGDHGRHRITSLFALDEKGRLAGAIHMHDLLSAGL